MLRRMAHPGIVQLLGTEGADPPDGLVLRTVSGGDLTALALPSVAVIAGLGAALATTVADLHAVGFSHGGIEASHVLLDEGGRPVLCSLGRSREASAGSPDGERRYDDDVRALATMLLHLLPSAGCVRVGSGPAERWLLQLAAARVVMPGGWRGGWCRRCLTPDFLARNTPGRPRRPREQRLTMAGARIPDRPLRRRFTRRPRRGALRIGVGIGILLLGVTVVAGWAAASGPARRHATSGMTTACPAVDDGCVPVTLQDGVLDEPTGRFEVGRAGRCHRAGPLEMRANSISRAVAPGDGGRVGLRRLARTA